MMNLTGNFSIQQAASTLMAGGIVAYPTESVYGLGCDPNNHKAVTQLLRIKNRSFDKGFILIADNWEALEPWVQPIPHHLLTAALTSWPGPVTWVFPAATNVPHWVTGHHKNIAVRVTNHPEARKLCQAFAGPIISTSANLQGSPPARDIRTLKMIFHDQIDAIIQGNTGDRTKPTPIYDILSGECLRKG